MAVSTDCRTTAIDFSTLQQQQFGGGVGTSMPFLLWFSGGGGDTYSPAVFQATYLSSSPYGGFNELPNDGREVLASTIREVSGGINGRIVISEEVHTYKIRIPREAVPEGATQIHAMPLFVLLRSTMPVLIDMFEQGPNLNSPDFEEFSRSITQGDRQ